ncbi:MAG: tetratricopeptide repeat protein [Planctomycetota bacterium]|jgi:DNA-directed RNA polymerase subunit alpha
MAAIAQMEIDLFGSSLPAMDEISRLALIVHASETNQIAFMERLETNLPKGGQNARLAAGIGLYIIGRNDEAVEKLAKSKNTKEKFIYLALALRRLGRLDEAIENLKKALDYGADTLSITLEKVTTYRYARNFDAAANELKNCANFENVSAEYHYQLGRLQEAEGLYNQAVQNYQTAVKLSANHLKALFRLAFRADIAGDEETAIGYYKQLAAKPTAHVNALLNLAVLYEDGAEFERSAQCIDKVLKHHPNHPRALLFKKDIESSKTMFYDEEKEKKKDYRTQILETPLSDFELSVRSRNCFKKMNIGTLGDLVNITEAELLSYKNFGETSLKEIKVVLESRGLRLGMAFEEKHVPSDEPLEPAAPENHDRVLLSKSVEDLNLSVRCRKCLEKLNIHTVGDLVQKTDAELLGCKNFGVTSLNEIKKTIENLGLSLRTLD